MKGKQKDVCHTCRYHKIGCDGKLPSCTQCTHTGRDCAGYKLDMVFVSYSAKPASRKKSPSSVNLTKASHKTPRSTVGHSSSSGGTGFRQIDPWQIAQLTGTLFSDELMAVINSRFIPKEKDAKKDMVLKSGAVGLSWVQLLPSILAGASSKELITTAIGAFGMMLLDRDLEGNHESLHSVKAYVATLQLLNTALRTPGSLIRIETATAIACLGMVEVMLPKPDNVNSAHFGGLCAVINKFSPDAFSSRAFHGIFVGVRPVLLFQALVVRKFTFLSQEDWLTAPFRYHPPSDIDMIIGESTILPSIMEEIDGLQALRPEMAAQRARNLKVTLSEVLARLANWDRRFDINAIPKRRSSQHMETTDGRQDEAYDYWFPEILAANIHISIWTFQVICHAELTKLTDFLCGSDEISISNRLGLEEHNTSLSTLSNKICQCMEYLLHEDMMLYGPVTAMFSLVIVHKILIADMDGNKKQIKRYQAYLDRLRNKGIFSAPTGITEVYSTV